MNRQLSSAEINYVFYHLEIYYDGFANIRKYFIFQRLKSRINENKIIFYLSDKTLDCKSVKYIDNIPILYPLYDEPRIFTWDGNNLNFNDDLLKSSFYLLSGYQETKSEVQRDNWDRFPYKESIQKRLDITTIPVVNYYFKWIIDGINFFLFHNNLNLIKMKECFKFTFFLSHDVDRISYYNHHIFKAKLKKLYAKKNLSGLMALWKYSLQYLSLKRHKDPYWNFNTLINIEKSRNCHSSYFFLNRDVKHLDSYYKFSDLHICNLILQLKDEGMEIGLHGSVNSYLNKDLLSKHKQSLESVIGESCHGIRQHRLIYKHPETALYHEETKFTYDTSLGFSENVGFRNGFCRPFKPFNHIEQQIINIWEIPLMVMDGTLFNYQKLDYMNAEKLLSNMLSEVIKFNGIFSMLWHNNFLNEIEYPGIESFYIKTIDKILSLSPLVQTGIEIIRNIPIAE